MRSVESHSLQRTAGPPSNDPPILTHHRGTRGHEELDSMLLAGPLRLGRFSEIAHAQTGTGRG